MKSKKFYIFFFFRHLYDLYEFNFWQKAQLSVNIILITTIYGIFAN